MNGAGGNEPGEGEHIFLGIVGGLVPFLVRVAAATAESGLPDLSSPIVYWPLLSQVALGALVSWLVPTQQRFVSVYHGATAPAVLALFVHALSGR